MTPDLRSQRGFTIIEMMIAVLVMMAVTGGVFSILNPSQGTFQAQPEVSDMQQRMRVGFDTLQKDLVMAGAGAYQGATTGALYNMFAPIMPYRLNGNVDEPRNDTISLIFVPATPAQTSLKAPMPPNSVELKGQDVAACTAIDPQNGLCGFKQGMRLLIYDTQGNWDTFTITQVQNAAAHLQHMGQDLNRKYEADSAVTQAMTQTYYLKNDATTNTYQLMYFDGYQTDLPVVDNVVKLEFSYFGDPLPPQLLPNKPLAGIGPWTTYGPKPPGLGVPNAPWADGENCTFSIVSGAYQPRLATLDVSAAQVTLPLASFNDGPWCPNADTPDRFDADLLRIRRVRVKLRVQVAKDALRGPAGALFLHGGKASTAERYVPDQEIQFDVTPRNMNLGR